MTAPTYQQLIELLEEAEQLADSEHSIAELLTINFSRLFPHIKIGRPGRFLETVHRINSPLIKGTLAKSFYESYLLKEWMPRSRNPGTSQSAGMINNLCIKLIQSCYSTVYDSIG